ncbi:MAG: hypothetical protein SCJ93_03770 [Bacillota bacterium]|nr:hypothetical protein [Bacillota bacterium]
MSLNRNTTIFPIVLLIIIGIVGIYYMMKNSQNQVSYDENH